MQKILKPRVNNPSNESGRNKTGKKILQNDNKIIKPCSKPMMNRAIARRNSNHTRTHTYARGTKFQLFFNNLLLLLFNLLMTAISKDSPQLICADSVRRLDTKNIAAGCHCPSELSPNYRTRRLPKIAIRGSSPSLVRAIRSY